MGNHACIEDTLPKFTPEEMLAYIKYIQRNALVQPRTYWIQIPFYIVTKDRKQHFEFGYRPEDLAHIDTIEQKTWEKHEAYIRRLERFPLDRAEYYNQMMQTYGLNTVREIANVMGRDWSYIAKTLKVLELPQPIKDFLTKNKNNPAMVKFFHLKKLLEIVYEKEERLQLAKFRQFIEEFEMVEMKSILTLK